MPLDKAARFTLYHYMGESKKIVRQSEFARMCNISRAAIGQAINKNKIILNAEKMIDLSNHVNESFLSCHQSGGKTINKPQQTPEPKTKPKKLETTPHGKTDGKKPATKKTAHDKPSKPTTNDDNKPEPIDLVNEKQKAIDQGDIEAAEKIQITIDRNYYESLKIKNDAELKAISIDQKNGTLAEREIIEGLVLELNKTIQEQFFNCVVKQSVEICARLGKVGFEQDVQDVLATDNSRRIHEVKRVTARFLWDRYIKPVTCGQNPYLVDTEDGEAEE
jgi:hypothetical protein